MAVGVLTYHLAIFIFLSVRHEIYRYKIWPKFLQSKNCYLNFEPSRHMINSPTSIRIEYFSMLFPLFSPSQLDFYWGLEGFKPGRTVLAPWRRGYSFGAPKWIRRSGRCIIIYQVWCLMELLHLLSRFWKWQEVLCDSDHIHQQRIDALTRCHFSTKCGWACTQPVGRQSEACRDNCHKQTLCKGGNDIWGVY